MSRNGLVLSVYPGIDLLGRAFEEEGYTVVRGPDPLWGGDVRAFHPPPGVFEGVIGGPPCQHWTRLMFLNKHAGAGLDWVVSEYARIVEEAQPAWFLMEEVLYAPMPLAQGYHDYDVVLRDHDVGGVQPRERRFTFGTPDCRMLNVIGWERVGEGVPWSIGANSNGNGFTKHGIAWDAANPNRDSGRNERRKQSILADGRAVPVRIGGNGKEKRSAMARGHDPGSLSISGAEARRRAASGEKRPYEGTPDLGDMCEAQGLPRDFTDHMPFTKHGKQLVIGNGVSMALGRAVAQAVRRATA